MDLARLDLARMAPRQVSGAWPGGAGRGVVMCVSGDPALHEKRARRATSRREESLFCVNVDVVCEFYSFNIL